MALLVEAATVPDIGTYVEILRPGFNVVGRVARAAHGHFEVTTREPVTLAALTSPAGAQGGLGQGAVTQLAPWRRARLAAMPEQHDRSRSLGACMEFSLFGACGLIAAATMGGAIFQTLTQPLAEISQTLANSRPAVRTN